MYVLTTSRTRMHAALRLSCTDQLSEQSLVLLVYVSMRLNIKLMVSIVLGFFSMAADFTSLNNRHNPPLKAGNETDRPHIFHRWKQ